MTIERVMPKRMFQANTAGCTIAEIIRGTPLREEFPAMYADVPEDRWLFNFVLPPFQRPVVWDEARMVRFVESVWMGLHLGTYVVNELSGFAGDKAHSTDLWLIDGQQRITALKEYVEDKFPVYGYRWSEITEYDRRDFRSRTFSRSTVQMTDETDLRRLYDMLNFGGVAHTEDQRALPEGE